MQNRIDASMTREAYEARPMLIGPEDTGAMLGLSIRTVQEYARRGVLPAKKIGGKWRFNKEVVARFAGII